MEHTPAAAAAAATAAAAAAGCACFPQNLVRLAQPLQNCIEKEKTTTTSQHATASRDRRAYPCVIRRFLWPCRLMSQQEADGHWVHCCHEKIRLFSTSTQFNVKSVMFSTSWRKVTLQETSAQWHFWKDFWEMLADFRPRFILLHRVHTTFLRVSISFSAHSECLLLNVTDWRCETAEQERERVEQCVLDTPTSTERPEDVGTSCCLHLNERSWTHNHSWRISPTHSDAVVPPPAVSFHFSRWWTKCLLCAWLLAPPLAAITPPSLNLAALCEENLLVFYFS